MKKGHAIGFLQFEPSIGRVEHNTERLSEMIDKCEEFELLVMPELAASGYVFRDKEEMVTCAEVSGRGIFTQMIIQKARERSAYLVAGFPERDGSSYYNSCILAGPEGILAVYRKIHLFMNEKNIFLPGNIAPPVVQTKVGTIGLLICLHWAFPELWRILALKGADIVAHPSNLVTPYAQQAVPVHSLCNGYFTITANRTGKERGVQFSGKSFIAGNRGEILSMVDADVSGTRIIRADTLVSRDKAITSGNDLIEDRKPHLYKDILT